MLIPSPEEKSPAEKSTAEKTLAAKTETQTAKGWFRAERPPRVRTAALSTTCVVLGLIGFAVISGIVLLNGTLPTAADSATWQWFVGIRNPLATSALVVITTLTSPVEMTIICSLIAAVWVVWKRVWVQPLLLLGTMLVAVGISTLIKHAVNRMRPPSEYMMLAHDSSPSFPSGHTLGITLLALSLSYLILSRGRNKSKTTIFVVASMVLIIAVAVSRLYLGYHWLTDVSASFFLALVLIGLLALADRGLERWRGRSTRAGQLH